MKPPKALCRGPASFRPSHRSAYLPHSGYRIFGTVLAFTALRLAAGFRDCFFFSATATDRDIQSASSFTFSSTSAGTSW